MNTSSFSLKDSSLSLEINDRIIRPGYDFKIVSFEVSEGIFKVPTFTMVYSTPVNTEKMDLSKVDISLEIQTSDGDSFRVSYSATVLMLAPNKAQGVLIPKDSYCYRYSKSFGNSSLDSIIKDLKLTSSTNYTLDSNVQNDNNFFQLNETNWQFGSRILNLMGSNYLWAVTEDTVKIFSPEISNTKSVNLSNFEYFSANSSKLIKSMPDSIDSNSNFFYGTHNLCKPSVSSYPKVCLESLVAKRKYTDWKNVVLTKTTYMKVPDLAIGDYVKFDWKSDQLTDFVVTGLSYKLAQSGNTFDYTFANYSKWNPLGV